MSSLISKACTIPGEITAPKLSVNEEQEAADFVPARSWLAVMADYYSDCTDERLIALLETTQGAKTRAILEAEATHRGIIGGGHRG